MRRGCAPHAFAQTVDMRLVLSIDAELLARARVAARNRGMSLEEYVRECLRALTRNPAPDQVADELLELMETHGGRYGRRRTQREDAYDGRVG